MASNMALSRQSLRGGQWMPFGQRQPSTVAISEAKVQCAKAQKEFEEAIGAYDPKLLSDFKDVCRNPSPPSENDILRTITAITDLVAEKQHTNIHRKRVTNISRFFERLIKLAPVGDVIVGGAQNLAVSCAWGAIRLALEVAVSYTSFFEKVSDLLVEIGKFTEINHELAVLFPHRVDLKASALEYLAVVLRVSTEIVAYAAKSRMQRMLLSIDGDFSSRVEPLAKELRGHAQSIERIANAESMKANQEAHNVTKQWFSQLVSFSRSQSENSEKRERDDWRYRIIQQLGSQGRGSGHNWSYYFGKGRSRWLLGRNEYASWKGSATSRTFWLHGKLGSGKSVALASICSDLTASKELSNSGSHLQTISHFFCRDGEARSALASTIIDSLTAQIVRNPIMEQSFNLYLKEVGGSRALELASESCIELLLSFTPKSWKCYIILDGLDQLSLTQMEVLFQQLSVLSKSRNVMLCCSSHPDQDMLGRVKSILYDSSAVHVVSMDDIDRSAEANDFITAEMAKWDGRGWHFQKPDSKARIMEALRSHWDSMFLWLKLQMELIEDDLRDGCEIDYILSRIHPGLSALYERRLSEIAERSPRMGRTILQLVTGADPPMKVQELRIAANIEPGITKWSPATLSRKLNGSVICMHYGGRLLEVDDATDEVHLIHGSVALHLCGDNANEPLDSQSKFTAPMHFTFREAKDLIGLVCITYLNLPGLDQSLITRPRSAEPGHAEARGMAVMTRNIIDSSGKDRSWLSPVLQKRHNRLNNSLDLPAFMGELAIRSSGEYVLTDFLKYAETNWLAATRTLNMKDAQTELWLNIFNESTSHGRLPDALKDPRTGLCWAIEEANRPLFQHHVVNIEACDIPLDKIHDSMLDLILFQWVDISVGGPVLTRSIDRLYTTDRETFQINWQHILRIAYISHNKRSKRIPWALHLTLYNVKILGLRDEVAGNLLELLMRSKVKLEIFSAMVGFLNDPSPLLLRTYKIRPSDGQKGELTAVAWVVTRYQGYDAIGRVKALVAAGATPNDGEISRHYLPLFIAIDKEDMSLIDCLVRHGANVSSGVEGQTPLIVAVKTQKVEIVKCMMEHNARIEDEGWAGETALHIAARQGHIPTLQYLLDHQSCTTGALHKTNACGLTPLFEAVRGWNQKCAEMLIDAGARQLLDWDGQGYDVVTVGGKLDPGRLTCLVNECGKIHTEWAGADFVDGTEIDWTAGPERLTLGQNAETPASAWNQYHVQPTVTWQPTLERTNPLENMVMRGVIRRRIGLEVSKIRV